MNKLQNIHELTPDGLLEVLQEMQQAIIALQQKVDFLGAQKTGQTIASHSRRFKSLEFITHHLLKQWTASNEQAKYRKNLIDALLKRKKIFAKEMLTKGIQKELLCETLDLSLQEIEALAANEQKANSE